MAQIDKGRYTARYDQPLAIFMIGMRVNRLWQFNKWLPVARAMNPMIQTLIEHPEKGFLGAQTFFYWRGVALVQYWRSFEDLEKFARSPQEPHLSAWQRFNKAVGNNGSVGIWHETYEVPAGGFECIYNNMPIFGLAKATNRVPAVGGMATARRRMQKGENKPAVASEDLAAESV